MIEKIQLTALLIALLSLMPILALKEGTITNVYAQASILFFFGGGIVVGAVIAFLRIWA